MATDEPTQEIDDLGRDQDEDGPTPEPKPSKAVGAGVPGGLMWTTADRLREAANLPRFAAKAFRQFRSDLIRSARMVDEAKTVSDILDSGNAAARPGSTERLQQEVWRQAYRAHELEEERDAWRNRAADLQPPEPQPYVTPEDERSLEVRERATKRAVGVLDQLLEVEEKRARGQGSGPPQPADGATGQPVAPFPAADPDCPAGQWNAWKAAKEQVNREWDALEAERNDNREVEEEREL